MKMRRMVVKIGSSSLTNGDGKLATDKMESLVENVSALMKSGEWQVVVVSSGAVAAGIGKLGWRKSGITLPEKQAAAAVGQGLLMHEYERLFGRRQLYIAQVLLTRSDLDDRKRFVHTRNTLLTLLKNGIVPIVNENDTVAVEELRFGDNDALASLSAVVVESDLLVLLTDTDGLYTANPKRNKDAVPIQKVEAVTPELLAMAGGATSAVGTGGMYTKLKAASVASEAGIDTVICHAATANLLSRIVAGEPIGTRIQRRDNPAKLREAWLMHGARPEGSVSLDTGAISALTEHGSSLLLPGVTDIAGDFQEGSVILLTTASGESIGRGLVNFSSNDLRFLLSRQKAGEKLYNLQEVVHRNDLVLTQREVLK